MNIQGSAALLTTATLTERADFVGKCTMYFKGGLGIVAVRCTKVAVTSGKYAQYSDALFITYRETRKRKDRTMTQTSFPSVLVVEGHDTPEPDGIWGSHEVTPTATISRGRYSSCDPRWQGDFDKMIGAAIEAGAVKVIFDGRQHNPNG